MATEDNPFELDDTAKPAAKTGPVGEKTKAAAKPKAAAEDAKAGTKRRTKEEIHADEVAAAKELLAAEGLQIVEQSDDKKDEKPKGKPSEKYVLGKAYNERSGEIVGGIKGHNGIGVGYIQVAGWIGPEQLMVGIDQLQDVHAVVTGLLAQLDEDNA